MHIDMFGHYHVAIGAGGVTVTDPQCRVATVTGADAMDLVAEYLTARDDIAAGGSVTRFARIGERAAAEEIFAPLFSERESDV